MCTGRAFHLFVWIALILAWIFCSIVWHLVSKDTFLNSSTQMLSLFSTCSITWMERIQATHLRIFSISIMLTSIVIINGLQSLLYTNLQEPGRYSPPNSLQGVVDDKLIITCKMQSYCIQLFMDPKDPILKQLSHILRKSSTPTSFVYYFPRGIVRLEDVLTKPQYAVVYRCSRVRKNIEKIKRFSDNLHIVEEVLTNGLLLFDHYEMKFPFVEDLQRVLFGFQQSGIAHKVEELEEWLNNLKVIFSEKKSNSNLKIFSMNDLQIAFIILFIGETFAIIIFLFEVLKFI